MKVFKYVERPVRRATDSHDRGYYQELSPADLAALNLGAVRVLEELEDILTVSRVRADDTVSIFEVLKRIEELESEHLSPSALAEIREMQIWAKAWRWALERRYITFSQREECELQARHEIDKEGEPDEG